MKNKICTMNCGPHVGDKRTNKQRKAACTDCIESIETITAPASAPDIAPIMEQAQIFASAWALVGGRFDDGTAYDTALNEKEDLRKMIEALAFSAAPAA